MPLGLSAYDPKRTSASQPVPRLRWSVSFFIDLPQQAGEEVADRLGARSHSSAIGQMEKGL